MKQNFHLTHRQVSLALLALQFLATLNLFIGQLIGLTLIKEVPSALLGVGALVFGLLLWVYWRGWEYVRHVVVVIVTILFSLFLPEPFVSTYVPFMLLLPVALAMVLTDIPWVTGSALALYAALLVRAGGTGVYAEPATILMYSMVVGSLVVGQYMIKSADRQVNASSVTAAESEERLRIVIAGTPIILSAIDRKGVFTLSEGAGLPALGLAPGDVVGQSAFELYKNYPDIVEMLRSALQGEHMSMTLEFSDHWYDVRYLPKLDEQGAVVGAYGVGIDVTERTQAEHAIKKSEQRLSSILNNSPDTIYLLDQSTGKAIFINREEFCGYSMAELEKPGSIISAVHPDDLASLKDNWEQIKTLGVPDLVEYRLQNKSGEWQWINQQTTVIKCDPHGAPTQLLITLWNITEHKHAEQALKYNEILLQHVLDSSPAVIFVKDCDSTILLANRAMASFYNLSVDEVISRRQADLHRELGSQQAEVDKWLADDREVIDAGRSKHLIESGTDTNNRTRWFETVKYPIDIGEGRLGVLVFSEDITERKQAEEALRDRNAQLARAQQVAHMGFLNWNLVTNEIYWSEEIYNLYGIDSQVHESTIDLTMKLVHPDDLEFVQGQLELALQDAAEYDIDHRILRPDGGILWVHAQAELMRDADGTPISLLGTVVDITERKRAEEALQESETRYRRIVSNFPDIIYRYRKAPVPGFEFVSPSVSKILGYTPEEHYADPELGFRIIHPDDRTSLMKMTEGNPPEIPHIVRWIRKDGAVIWMEDRFTSIYDEQGKLIGIEGVARDITERVQAKETLEKRYKELSAIYYASRRMQELLSPDQLAQAIIEVLEHTIEYTYGAVLLLEAGTGALDPFAISAQGRGTEFIRIDKDYIRSRDVRIGRGITGWVAEHGESLRLDDVSQDSRYLPLREDIHSELCVPLKVQDQVIGVLNVESTQASAYSGDDQRVLEIIAAITAVGIHNMRLLDELRLRGDQLTDLSRRLVEAYETQQRTIGRELHDQIGQMLTALKLTLKVAPQLPMEKAKKKLARAQEILDDLLQRVSQLSLELRPPMLDDLGLVPALVWCVNRFQEQAQIEVDFKHSGLETRRFEPETETTAYRVVQEALTNAARHAHATRVRLEVRARGGQLEIRIEDDGQGFDPQAAFEKHRGLSGMRERVGLLNGRFKIDTQAGKGTLVSVELPLGEGSI